MSNIQTASLSYLEHLPLNTTTLSITRFLLKAFTRTGRTGTAVVILFALEFG